MMSREQVRKEAMIYAHRSDERGRLSGHVLSLLDTIEEQERELETNKRVIANFAEVQVANGERIALAEKLAQAVREYVNNSFEHGSSAMVEALSDFEEAK